MPSPADYIPLVQAQTTAQNTNLSGPVNTVRYNPIGDSGQWEQTSQFSPEVQPIWEQQLSAALNPDAFNQRVSDASFQRAWNYLQPIQQQEQMRFEQGMADRGLPVGGGAYDDAYANMMRSQNSARENAALSAILAGEQSANNAFGRMGSITGRQAVPSPQGGDVMGPANMAMQNNMANAANNQANKSSTTGALGNLGAAWMLM